MKTFIHRVCTTLFLGLISVALFAQEKTQAYYNTHESEILPDAHAAFKEGGYERAVELCKWHYIFVGDSAADSLRDQAERCAQLSKEMAEFYAEGKTDEAQETAKTLLSINPNDTAAKRLLEELEKPVISDQPVPIDTVIVDVPVVNEDEMKQDEVPTEIPIDEAFQDFKETENGSPVNDSVSDVSSKSQKIDNPRTRFVVKAGLSILDLKQLSQTLAPGGSFGVYDVGGSPLGMEAGFYLCPGLAKQSASLFGIDASVVFRATSIIYPKAGLGFFSCKSTDETDATTKGMCAFAGLTFLIGGHLCLEIGAKYYPVVRVSSLETVTTAGVSYDFPASREILGGGFCPGVSIGFAF